MVGLFILLVTAVVARAQTFTVLHEFTGGADGSSPSAGLTMDRAGNLYGTASLGGDGNNGTVFKLSRAGSGWILTTLYNFQGGEDGSTPQARVVFGPDGTLYGTTTGGAGFGTVFNLRPSATACKTALCPWTETVLYRFTGGSDGSLPEFVDLVFDAAGNIYGTTFEGGSEGSGVVFELTRSGEGWTESAIYTFNCLHDGCNPYSGVIFDSAGNLFGTNSAGGADSAGTVYELTPSASGWTETTLLSFGTMGSEGSTPIGGLIFDSQGNLYGTTLFGGTVFELQRNGTSWAYSELYAYSGFDGPEDSLTMDPAGRLYGTIFGGNPEVLQLTLSNGQWTQTGFNGSAGSEPVGNVILDASGNVYGTASEGGTYNNGVVFEITP